MGRTESRQLVSATGSTAKEDHYPNEELGIEPVFPGYAGMVPRNIGEKLGYQIADPGKWCGFPRPAFLSTEDEHFDSFAAMYYEELEKLYGKAKYYSMDPFHEGGNTEGVDLAKAGTSIMSAMKKANPEAVWVMQAWQANPREAMVNTLDSSDLLVLDCIVRNFRNGVIRSRCGIGRKVSASMTGSIVCCLTLAVMSVYTGGWSNW